MRTLIVGAGGIAEHHCKSLKKLGVEITGVYDVDEEKAEALAYQWGTKRMVSFEEGLSQTDMIHLLTPPSKRIEYALKAMEMGKHVFAEKPLADKLEDAWMIEKKARDTKPFFMTAFTQRFRRGYKLLKELYQSGALGGILQIFSVRIGPGVGFGGSLQDSWRTDKKLACGMTIESLSHDIDFMRSLAGEIVQVKASILGTISELPLFDNNSDSVLTFENGSIGTILSSWNSHIAFNMRGIIGTKGTAILQGNDLWDFTEFKVKLADKAYEEVHKIEDIFQSGEAYLEENKYFIECIQNGIKPECDAAAGRKALEISLGMLESHNLNKTVVFGE